MRRARLQSLPQSALALDTETWRIEPGCVAPPLVCGSVGWLEPGPRITGTLLDKRQALEAFCQALESPDVVIAGANIAYDLLVFAVEMSKLGLDAMPAIFAALAAGRVFDILIAESMHAIARGHFRRDPRTGSPIKNPETGKPGSYSLATVTDMVLGRADAKSNDEWRLRYRELDGIPLDQWPQAARDYPVDDVRNTAECALAQVGHLPKVSAHHRYGDDNAGAACLDCGATTFSSTCMVRRPHENLHEVANQTYSAFCLHAGAAWGLGVDQSAVDIIERFYRAKRARLIPPFIEGGVLREDESEDRSALKRMIARAYGATEPCPVCAGTGKVPSPKSKTLTCPDCRGRCQPWKSGGKIKDPTVAICARCSSTGRIPHPKPDMINCVSWQGEGEEREQVKTCDGSGLVLIDGVPRSEKEGIAYGRDALTESGDDFLMAYGDFQLDAKVLKDYVPYLRTARVPAAGHAAECPRLADDDEACTCKGPYVDVILTLKPNAVLETGRVSYAGYIQLFPRKPGFTYKDPVTGVEEYIPSLRECFVARGPTYRYVEVPDDHVLQPGEERVAC